MTLNRKQTRKLLIREIKKEQIKRAKYIEVCDIVLKENQFIIENKKYLTQQEINENFLASLQSVGGDLLSNLLPGFIGDIKQKIATGLLRNLGLNPRSAFGRIVINIFEEIKYTELMSYFSNWKVGCPKFIEVLLRAISDATIEYLIEKFLGAKDAAQQTGITGTFRETLTTTINEKLIPQISPMISKFICKINIPDIINKLKKTASGEIKPGDLMSGITGTSKAPSKIASSTTTATTADKVSDLAKQFES